MDLKTVLLVALFATAFMLAYGCAGNQPGAGLEVQNDDGPPPPPPDNSSIGIVGVNDVPPAPPTG